MVLAICGTRARDYWNRFTGDVDVLARFGSAKLEGEPATTTMLRDARSMVDEFMPARDVTEFLVARSERGLRLEGTRLWAPARCLSGKSLVKLPNGLLISSPELSFFEAFRDLGIHSAIEYGFQLCGSFALDRSRNSGTASRKPLTTPRRLANFLSSNPGLFDSKKLRPVLPFIFEGSASPQESRLAMKLCLPSRLGGFGLPPCRMNFEVAHDLRKAGPSARKVYCVDLCWPERKVAVEYDSEAEHLDEFQHGLDVMKQTAMRNMGFTAITVAKAQASGKDAMEVIAKEIARLLGVRLRMKSKFFRQQQDRLFALR